MFCYIDGLFNELMKTIPKLLTYAYKLGPAQTIFHYSGMYAH